MLGRAHGVVTLPDDATDADEALQLAGQRLAEDQRLQRQSAKHQAHDTLMAIISKRHPEMGPHLRAVAYHVLSLGRTGSAWAASSSTTSSSPPASSTSACCQCPTQ